MENTQDHIQRIHNKLQLLLKHVAALEKENELQRKDIHRLRLLKDSQEIEVKNLQQQNYILKAATNSLNEADKIALEQSINKYIRDIDKCIGLLSE